MGKLSYTVVEEEVGTNAFGNKSTISSKGEDSHAPKPSNVCLGSYPSNTLTCGQGDVARMFPANLSATVKSRKPNC